MLLIRLFWEFSKTGLFAVGGGLATFPFLHDMGRSTGWFTSAQLADMVAVSESTPGPIGVNMATYVGFTTAGIPGAIAATLGLITPSVIIIMLIAAFLQNFRDNKNVNSVFYGLRPASTGLIAASGLSVLVMSVMNIDLFKLSGSIMDLFSWKAVILCAALLLLTHKVKRTKDLHPIIFIIASALIGIAFSFAGAN